MFDHGAADSEKFEFSLTTRAVLDSLSPPPDTKNVNNSER